jgi:hypothetical protein
MYVPHYQRGRNTFHLLHLVFGIIEAKQCVIVSETNAGGIALQRQTLKVLSYTGIKE